MIYTYLIKEATGQLIDKEIEKLLIEIKSACKAQRHRWVNEVVIHKGTNAFKNSMAIQEFAVVSIYITYDFLEGKKQRTNAIEPQ